jgi:hypothetical protein
LNYQLLFLGILLTLAGAAFGFIPLILIGFLLILASPFTRREERKPFPQRPTPYPSGSTYSTPREEPIERESQPIQPTFTVPASSMKVPERIYNFEPLFPSSMFSMVPQQPTAPVKEKPETKGEGPDEVLQLLTLTALIRILTNRGD